MSGGPMSSPRFAGYLVALTVTGIAALASPFFVGEAFGGDLLPFVAFAILYTVAEYTGTLFNRQEGSVSFSATEAILLAALVALPAGEVLWVVAIGTVASEVLDRITRVKAVFNAAAAVVAVIPATVVSVALSDLASRSAVASIGAAAVGVVLYSLVTHLLVSIALAWAEKSPLLQSVRDVPRAYFVNLGASLLVGAMFASGYLGTRWSIVLFPLVLIALSLGYRAVLQQAQERERVESLHAASRALAAVPNLNDAIPGFLRSVATTVSALGAQVLLRDESDLVATRVYAGDVVSAATPVTERPLVDLLTRMDELREPLVGEDVSGELEPLASTLRARNFVAVPLVEADNVVGALVVHNRIGSEGFGDREIRLLEALGNELVATMASHRLFHEVEQERERFQLLVESVHDYAIFMLDPKGNVVSWNAGAERIQGFKAQDIVGRHFSRFYPETTEGTTWRNELDVAAREGRLEVEGIRVRKDGTEFLANEVVTPVRDEDGTLRGFAKVTRDITERVHAQQEKESLESQLHQVQKLESVGQLAGGIAHDFNNILAVISNCANFVLDALERLPLEGDDREVIQDVEEIKTASERARSLTRQLLVFSRRDAAEPRVLDVNEVITNMTKLMRRAVGESVSIRTELDPATGFVFADPGQLEQVLLNLAINARDAMSGSGSLVIATSEVSLDEHSARRFVELSAGDYVRIEVTDTGSGMPPDVIEKAFDPFFTTKPKGQGTGLGLATVYGIVRKARGHIGIRSRPGLGTTFTIHLPVVHEDAAGPDRQIHLDAPRGNGERILLVEDEAAVRAVARRLLTEGGYSVIEADNGRAALKVMNEELGRVDILVSDVVMPGMTGIELGLTLQSMYPRLPAVYMTGYSEASNYANELGDRSVLLHKPFDRVELLQAVHDLLHPEVQTAPS